MSEVKPTRDDLRNPYVLQLLGTICKQDDRIEELEGIIRAALGDGYDSTIMSIIAEQGETDE